jgi:predicted Zn-dependent protease
VLKLTAERGRYLAPFARILLAIAYVRDNDNTRARELLSALRQEFPDNSLFALEIARLDSVR